MVIVTYQYPGDPVSHVQLDTGAAFKAARGPGEIRIGGFGEDPDTVINFDEAICDSCNGEVADDDLCLWDDSRLYCLDCGKRQIGPYTTAVS